MYIASAKHKIGLLLFIQCVLPGVRKADVTKSYRRTKFYSYFRAYFIDILVIIYNTCLHNMLNLGYYMYMYV